ncbi:MAG: DNA alkylation repair protein [Cyanobacteria bacterium P01_F01_bin.53]
MDQLEAQLDMEQYLQALQALFSQHADPVKAVPMKKYMRNQFEFLGIKSPEHTRLFKQFVAEHGLPTVAQLEPLILTLWQWPEREYQYLALSFLRRLRSQLAPAIAPTIETLIVEKSWWDTIDSLASHTVGDLYTRYPQEMAVYITRWRSHSNFWLRRTTLLFQLGYKSKTDEALLFSLVRENLGSKEFFINKAIGWALREYSKTAPTAVQQFVETTELASLSRREALKWMKTHPDKLS